MLWQVSDVGAQKWCGTDPFGSVEEGRFGLLGLKDEQHQRQLPAVVGPDVVALEVALVGAQPLRHAIGRRGATLELQQVPMPIIASSELERGVGVDQVTVASVLVADLRAMSRQQVENLVVGRLTCLGAEDRTELRDAGLVPMLNRHSLKHGADVTQLISQRRPPVQSRTHSTSVAKSEVGDALVSQQVAEFLALDETLVS